MDVIGDTLTKIRNAGMQRHATVNVKKTNLVDAILRILKNEGYILDYKDAQDDRFALTVTLKYIEKGKFVIEGIKRISRLSRRIYTGKKTIPHVFNNYGIAVLSTSKGVMTGKEARALGVGGEVLCYVW